MIDASIYNMIQPRRQERGPMDHLAQAMQIKHLVGQNELAGMQRGELEKSIQRKGMLRDLFARGDVKPEDVDAVDYETGMAYRQKLLDREKAQAGLDKDKADTRLKNFQLGREQHEHDLKLLQGIGDQTGWTAWRNRIGQRLGPDALTDIPPAFTPEAKSAALATGLSIKDYHDQFAARIEYQDVGGSKVPVQTNPRAPGGIGPVADAQPLVKTQTPESVATNATTRRGQDMTQATSIRGQDLTNTRERDVELQRQIAAARESGKDIVNARQQLPQAIANAERGVRLIDEMVGSTDGKTKPHPGFQSAVGVSLSKLASPFWAPPGTDRRDFDARLAEIKGGAFLQAFESLKGGGQITQVEGEKATQAITRMESAQSEREFIKAAREFQAIVRGGMERAKAKAAQNPMAPGGSSIMAPPSASTGIKFLGFE